MSDYQALFDHDLHYVLGWTSPTVDPKDLEKFNETSIKDIKICEEMGFPSPCIIEFFDPELGQTQFVVSAIKDYSG